MGAEIKVYKGKEVRQKLTRKKRKEIARRVKAKLAEYPQWTRQLTLNQIHRSMLHDNAFIAIDRRVKGRKKPSAFAHLIPAKNESGEIKPGELEVGGWTSWGGGGVQVMREAVEEGKRRSNQVSALVHIENNGGQQAVQKSGGTISGDTRLSNYVTDKKGRRAQMYVVTFL